MIIPHPKFNRCPEVIFCCTKVVKTCPGGVKTCLGVVKRSPEVVKTCLKGFPGVVKRCP